MTLYVFSEVLRKNILVTLSETLSAEGMGTVSKNNLIGISLGIRPASGGLIILLLIFSWHC